MKISYLIAAFVLASAASAFSQERPRIFDNFDTARGVRISTPPSTAAARNRKGGPNAAVAAGEDQSERLSTGSGQKTMRNTARATMTVYDGVPAAEPRRPVLSSVPVMAAGNHLRGFSTGNPLVDSYIVDSSRRYNIDPLLIYAQMGQESSFKPRALSHKGASGLMQLMPATAARLGVTNIYDPKQNIEGGVKYMRMLLDMFGDLNLALAGYNAGENAVIKYGYQIPPYNETQDYVRRISARYKSMARTTAATASSRPIAAR